MLVSEIKPCMPVTASERRTAQYYCDDLPSAAHNRGNLRLRAEVETQPHQQVGSVTDSQGGDG